MKRPDIRRRIAELFKTCAILDCAFSRSSCMAFVEQPLLTKSARLYPRKRQLVMSVSVGPSTSSFPVSRLAASPAFAH
jgi:hypothetical protein